MKNKAGFEPASYRIYVNFCNAPINFVIIFHNYCPKLNNELILSFNTVVGRFPDHFSISFC